MFTQWYLEPCLCEGCNVPYHAVMYADEEFSPTPNRCLWIVPGTLTAEMCAA